ncbi:glycosyl transferase [Actinomadura sp. KC06]|nr:glycosyl transferase [Actinomadura sp. KC06]
MLAAFAVLKNLWADPTRHYLVDGGQDQAQWEWFFAVTARSVTHLDDPFFTTLQNTPDGVNLMANTVMLGVSVPLTPVTLAFGPSVTWALVLTLGLAGTAAAWYALARRHLGLSRPAAAVAGGFCGFAPPMISHANAHPNFVALFVIPLIVGRLIRLASGEGRVMREGVFLGVLVAYQVFLGEEALLLAATGLAVFGVAYVLARPDAAMARRVAGGLAVAAPIAAALTAYALTRQFFGRQSYDGLLHGPAGNDVATLAAFARQSLAGHQAVPGPLDASTTEQNAFFGWPLLVLVVALAVWLRRDPAVRALGVVVVVAAVLSLGPEIIVNGRPTGVPGPWRVFSIFPLYESVLESRMTMVCVPPIGLLLAFGLDRFLAEGHPGTRVRLVGVVVLAQALVPIVPKPLPAVDRPPVPAFFTEGMWRRYVGPGRTLVPAPLPDVVRAEPLHWQIEAGFGFAVPEGYFIGPFGPRRLGGYGAPRRPTSELLRRAADDEDPPAVGGAERAAAFDDLAYWRADVVVLDRRAPRAGEVYAVVSALLGPGRSEGGVWLWDVRPITHDGPGR